MKRNQFYKGFTIVELIVVVSIISVLAALLIPAISGAREKARKSKCLANLRQLAVGASLQFIELENKLPHVGSAGGFCGGNLSQAVTLLFPYVGSDPAAFDCPSNPGTSDFNTFTEIIGTDPKAYTEYELNSNLLACDSHKNRKQTAIISPSSAIFAYDYPWDPDQSLPGHARIPHEGGINCAFMDGHAAWLSETNFNLGTGEAFYLIGISHPN